MGRLSDTGPIPTAGRYRRTATWALQVLLLAGWLHAYGAAAQTPAPDQALPSEEPTRESFSTEPFIALDIPTEGSVLSDSLPVLRPEIHLAEMLATLPGTFTHRFDRAGWPDGWSPFGLSPNTRPLTFEGMPFTQVFTGRPLYELIPFTWTNVPRMETVRFGRPVGVRTRLRPFEGIVPTTEGIYWRGGSGLQSIEVAHAQQRRRRLLGRPMSLHVMGAYGGRATNADYPGSDLTRGRRVQMRLRIRRPRWTAEFLNLHNRRRIGAHGGVIPVLNDFASIYQPVLATVQRPEAERRIVRNDLMGTLQVRLMPAGITSLAAYWTAEAFRYRNSMDTLTAESDRTGLRIRQPLARSDHHRWSVEAEAWTDRTAGSDGFHMPLQRRSSAQVRISDRLRVGRGIAELTAGWSLYRNGGGASGSIAWTKGDKAGVPPDSPRNPSPPPVSSEPSRRGGTSWYGEISTTVPDLPIAYASGFGNLHAWTGAGPGRTVTMRLETGFQLALFSVVFGAFGHQAHEPVDLFAAGDSVRVQAMPGLRRHAGLYADLGWRRDARRGLYAVVRPTLLSFGDAGASPLHRRLSATGPSYSGQARIGMRHAVFRGDLDFDAYVEAIAWSSLSSRELHATTGLLVVPEASSLVLHASGNVNLVAEIRVRSAKIFLVYDNVLSGTSLLPGNLLVPIYPLPARRFRLGVYWPIFG